MGWLRKLFNPTYDWQWAAVQLGSEYVSGGMFRRPKIELSLAARPITISLLYGETRSDDDAQRYTQVSLEQPCGKDTKVVLLRKWPGQRVADYALGLARGETSLPLIGKRIEATVHEAGIHEVSVPGLGRGISGGDNRDSLRQRPAE